MENIYVSKALFENHVSDQGLAPQIYKECSRTPPERRQMTAFRNRQMIRNRHFFREDTHVATKHRKRCSPSSVIRGMQIKTTGGDLPAHKHSCDQTVRPQPAPWGVETPGLRPCGWTQETLESLSTDQQFLMWLNRYHGTQYFYSWIYPKETEICVHSETCPRMFVTALKFSEGRNNPNVHYEWILKFWGIHTMEY